MAKEQQIECPSCHGAVGLGEVTCPHCGVNLKSGESFETQVKRAKGKSKHKDIYTGGLYVSSILAVALCVFAGYMYQRKVEGVISGQAEELRPLLEKFQHVRDMADAGQYAQARQAGEDLLKELKAADDAIKVAAFDATQVTDVYGAGRRRKPTGNDRGEKRLLANVIAKTQYLLDHMPAS